MSAAAGALRRVVYVSRARYDMGGEQPEMLAAILDVARRNNVRRGVTGALLYSERRFAQVLEGPPDAVEELFEAIQCDPRHDEIVVLAVDGPPARAFGAWSMAYAARPEVTPADFEAPDSAERLVAIMQAAMRNTDMATG